MIFEDLTLSSQICSFFITTIRRKKIEIQSPSRRETETWLLGVDVTELIAVL